MTGLELEAQERIDLTNALRALEYAKAMKRIDDFYDAWINSDTDPVDRRIMGRRTFVIEPVAQAAPARYKGPEDMFDINLGLSAD